MTKKMNPVVHFEMPMKNATRVSKFYQTVFGWDMEVTGEDFGGYLLAITTQSTKNGPKKKGIINGGFYPVSKAANSTHLVISVDNLAAHVNKVQKAGGKVLGKPQDVPHVGKFIMIKDSEGNRIALLQPVRP